MNRLALIACVALSAGCAAPRVNTQARRLVYPPLPESPGAVHSDSPAPEPRPVFVLWTLTAGTLDVLESCQDLSAPQWLDIAGPYPTLDTGGVVSYFVPVTGYAGTGAAFFRIRRVW